MKIAHGFRTWAGMISMLVAVTAPALAVRPAAAAEPDGKALYLKYCSACHGESAKGDGVVSGVMRPRPNDLTVIAKNSPGGAFPVADVAGRIDGSETARVHGDPDMPVWGEILRDNGQPGSGPGKIIAITEYLKTLQVK